MLTRSKFKWITFLAITFSLVLGLTGCQTTPATEEPVEAPTEAAAPTEESAEPEELTEFTLMIGTAFMSANDITYVVLPEELGYLEEEGLKQDVQFSAAGGQVLQLMASGQVDIGFGASVQTIIACTTGEPIKAVFNVLRKHATAIAVPADSEIQSPQDLKGATIGIVAEGSARALDGRAMINAAGMDPDEDVSWLAVGLGAQALSALQDGTVQALVLWDAAYADMENLGQEFRFFTFPYQQDLFSIVWNSSEDFIAEHPEVVIGFGRAQAKAVAFAMENPEAAVQIFVDAHPELTPPGVSEEKYFQDSLNILKNNLANMELEGTELYGSFPEGGWGTVQKYYMDLGLVENAVDDPSQCAISPGMIEEMNDFDLEAVREQARNYGQ